MQTDDFSDQAEVLGYPKLTNEMSDIHFGYTGVKDRWINSFNFFYGNQAEQSEDSSRSKYRRVGIEFNMAFNVMGKNSNWLVGPEGMVGYQYEQVVLSDTPTINSLAASLDTEYYSYTNFSIPASLGATIGYYISTNEEECRGILLNLRTGYRFGDSEFWELDNAVQVRDFGVEDSGVYATFSIAFVGMKKRD